MCPECESGNWFEQNEDGDTYFECRSCGLIIENGITTRESKKRKGK
jgi:transcription initiation factor TFIIIB Brf1 subunit/transcription initiation factor TFIIB